MCLNGVVGETRGVVGGGTRGNVLQPELILMAAFLSCSVADDNGCPSGLSYEGGVLCGQLGHTHTYRYVKLNFVNGASLLIPLMNLVIGIVMVRGYLVLVCVHQ